MEKEYIKTVYCHLAYMQSISCEMLGWVTHKLESRLLGEMSATLGTSLIAESEEDLKSLLMRVEKEN